MLKKLQKFLEKAKNPLVIVLGPTASGKTDLSLKIALKFNGEIISADSRQIYKEMPIATDVLKPKHRQNIPHHLIEIVKPDHELSMAKFRGLALQKIEEIYKRKHLPILTGGTGLYISAIIDNYSMAKIPPDKKLRKKLKKEAKEKGKEFVYAKLKKLDPQAAESIHPNNLRYVIRAIERAKSGKPSPVMGAPQYDTFLTGINWPRQELYERINQRVDNQLKRGLVKEVEKLLKKGYEETLPAMTSLGVKEIIPYIKGEQNLDECVEILKKNTRNYAKRQMTWFRRYDNVNWLKPEEL